MGVNVSLHANSYTYVKRTLDIRARLDEHRSIPDSKYAAINLEVINHKPDFNITEGEVSLFLDIDQVADLYFELGKLIDQYNTSGTNKLDDLLSK